MGMAERVKRGGRATVVSYGSFKLEPSCCTGLQNWLTIIPTADTASTFACGATIEGIYTEGMDYVSPLHKEVAAEVIGTIDAGRLVWIRYQTRI